MGGDQPPPDRPQGHRTVGCQHRRENGTRAGLIGPVRLTLGWGTEVVCFTERFRALIQGAADRATEAAQERLAVQEPLRGRPRAGFALRSPIWGRPGDRSVDALDGADDHQGRRAKSEHQIRILHRVADAELGMLRKVLLNPGNSLGPADLWIGMPFQLPSRIWVRAHSRWVKRAPIIEPPALSVKTSRRPENTLGHSPARVLGSPRPSQIGHRHAARLGARKGRPAGVVTPSVLAR